MSEVDDIIAAQPNSAYIQDHALNDLVHIKYAISLFLNSRMVEAEEFCVKCDPRRERLYISCGLSLIQCFKALMSYEDQDLQEALKQITHGNNIAAQHRAPTVPVTSLVTNWLWDSEMERLRNMNQVQRHAELLYAETLFAKALLGVVCSGSWLAFIKEALSFRAMINIYMQLGKFVQVLDKEAIAKGNGLENKSLDRDFRSGVELGVGASNLILSFLPKNMLAVVELFGYQGDRSLGLKLLEKTGGWTKEVPTPSVNAAEEGLRRCLTDIALLCFHLVISNFTFEGVDFKMARRILEWNLARYPDGVFYLFGQGRMRLTMSQPDLALESYQRAIDVQNQYRNLHYISLWEMAICNFAVWDIPASLKCWKFLEAEATWSPACYAYGMATCLLELGGHENVSEAIRLMEKIPRVLHKIAGKSIPIEKFVARKARKYEKQGKRLLLPALEFAYMFLAINHSPPSVLLSTILPIVTDSASIVDSFRDNPSNYPNGVYWDDFCLSHFLMGVCLRFIAYPGQDAVLSEDLNLPSVREEYGIRAQREFMLVNKHGPKLELDHWIVYHSHFELGRLYECRGVSDKARYHLELVKSGKSLEANPSSRKGKYSNQSALLLRTSAALDSISYRYVRT